jgi:branched-chain amino acid transport system substrate-binding protein
MWSSRPRRVFGLGVAAAAICLPAIAACSGGSGGSGGTGQSGLPSSIPVAAVIDETGPFAVFGSSYEQGLQLGIDQVNKSNLLDGSKLSLTVTDSASSSSTAASVLAQLVTGNAVAIIGLDNSDEALAAAPIAQKANVSLIADCAPTGLLSIGDDIFSVATQFNVSAPMLASNMVANNKTVSIIDTTDVPTLSSFASVIQPLLTKGGVKVLNTVGTTSSATDFSAVVTRALSGSPDGILISAAGAQVPEITQALKSAGYTGHLYGTSAQTSSGTTPAVENGTIFPTEWVPALNTSANKDFMSLFTAAHPNTVPTYETVDGYDAAQFLALAIKKAGKADRASILSGMRAAAAQGFTGPPGAITFGAPDGRQYAVKGLLAQIENGQLNPVSAS